MALRAHPLHGRASIRWSAAIFVTGLLTRVFFAVYSPGSHGDSELYAAMASHLVDGRTVALTDWSPTIVRPPGYPLFMAGVYELTGRSPQNVLIAQAILGATAGLILYAVLRMVVRRPIAEIAARWTAPSTELAY